MEFLPLPNRLQHNDPFQNDVNFPTVVSTFGMYVETVVFFWNLSPYYVGF